MGLSPAQTPPEVPGPSPLSMILVGDSCWSRMTSGCESNLMTARQMAEYPESSEVTEGQVP
jgi:hypothetical protein